MLSGLVPRLGSGGEIGMLSGLVPRLGSWDEIGMLSGLLSDFVKFM